MIVMNTIDNKINSATAINILFRKYNISKTSYVNKINTTLLIQLGLMRYPLYLPFYIGSYNIVPFYYF